MKSRTSSFHKTIFKKNLTRFAPVWGVYLLCLLLGLGMMYMEGRDSAKVNFWFANNMAACINVMGLVNLFFGPLMAMLLFGDLFNPRMCNALHAMPLRRESYFLTNVLSGLTVSLVPTAVMALASLPLLAGTVVHDAWKIGILWFIATNLQFLCYFGIAVFCVFCTGNRFAMAAVYAGINGGAFLIYLIIDSIFTPMLFGVVTPDNWVLLLTPIAKMLEGDFVEVENYNDLMRLFLGREGDMVANFWVNEEYYDLILWGLVGAAFLIVGLLMYRKRDLECAGDAVAVRWLAPVFQVACSVAVSAVGVFFLENLFGYTFRDNVVIQYTVLLGGLAVGWFAGKMFLERSTRVFRPKNWVGLGALTAIMVVSMVLTHFDVFGIEDWIPRAEKVSSVKIYASSGYTEELTGEADIQQIIRLHEMALEDRIEEAGAYPASYVEKCVGNVTWPEEGFTYGEEGQYDEEEPHLYADSLYIYYTLESGRQVTRQYYIWANQEEGEIVKAYASTWETVWTRARMGWYDEFDISQVYYMRIEGEKVPKELVTQETVQSLLNAIKADCEARNMAQHHYYHEGRFRSWDEEEEEYYYDRYLYISIYTGTENDYTAADFEIYPDAANTIQWLKDHDLLPYEIVMDYTGR